MAKKRKPRKKRAAKRRPKKSPPLHPLFKVFLGIAILATLVLVAGLLTHNFLLRKRNLKPSPSPAYTHQKPVYEIYPKKDIPPVKRKHRKYPPSEYASPPVALIIDDLGYDRKIAQKLLDLETVLTFSILPHSPYQREIAGAGRSRGYEIMLHLPMEPDEYPHIRPGPGALLTSMAPDVLIGRLINNLDAVPFIQGVNNHMGSKMTTASNPMQQIFSVLKKRNLYFIDSRSTPNTVCRASARVYDIAFGERDVFIDHTLEAQHIRQQLNRLVSKAKYQGEAIGIAHPHEITLKVLKAELPGMKMQVTFVPASKLAHMIR